MSDLSALNKTPLFDLHQELGGKLVDFATYALPVQYKAGIMAEHLHCRASAALFDVSHMGQAVLKGPDHETSARALEAVTPSAFAKLAPGRIRYSVFLNDKGGIIDDFMATRPLDPDRDGDILLVVNGACKEKDYAFLAAHLPENVSLERYDDKALMALQGPKAVDVLSSLSSLPEDFGFMSVRALEIGGVACMVSRSGYTGEDGFEISCAGSEGEKVARLLLSHEAVEPAGLGARDSLRLEAGLCLYGHDLDEETDPAEADLGWIIQKSRRERADFPGAKRILSGLEEGTGRVRVGILPDGRAPARDGTLIQDENGETIGLVTSGGFGPSLNGPLSMGYVKPAFSAPGTKVKLAVRKRVLDAEIVAMPFVPHHYVRKS